MAVIHCFVDASGIVENCEQLDYFDLGTRDLCQSQSIFQNPCPMADPMRAVPAERIIFKDAVDEGFEVDHGLGRRKGQ